MTELKRFISKTAAMDEWRDYHCVAQKYFIEMFPEDDPIELDAFVVSEKGWLNTGGVISVFFLAYINSEIAGLGSMTKNDGQAQVFADVIVLPEHRRNGVGTILLNRMREEAVNNGFKTFSFFSVDTVPAGEAFLTNAGLKKGLIQKGNQLIMKNLDINLMRQWVHGGIKNSYESGVWLNEVPEEHLENYAAAYNSINDAPHGNLENMKTSMTADSMRALVKRIIEGKNNIVISWVRNIENGEFAAISDIVITGAKKYVAFQNNTMTVPKYRGNGFGKLVKALNALYLIENRPQVRFIRTSNAEVNEAMLAINDKMGFKQFQVHTFWELEVEQ